MKILYDHTIFTNQKYGGISRYYYELMNQFANIDGIEYKSALLLSNNYYLQNSHKMKKIGFFPNFFFKGRDRIIIDVNSFYTKIALKQQKFDIFHPTYYDIEFLKYLDNKPFVVTVHDLIHKKFSELFSKEDKTSDYQKILIEKSSKIIAISNNTKKDIIKYYGIDSNKITVVYHGNSMQVTSDKNIKLVLPKKYILFVGARASYKNFIMFIKAFALLFKTNLDLSVVCAGGKPFTFEERELLKELGLENNVFQFTVSDKELSHIYSNALFFVFPSLYEGFGIPILEAFSCKCPLICSNTSSLPEIALNGAEYFNPYSITSIYESMERVLNTKARREELIENGSKRLEYFSWEKTARETLSVYESVLNE